MAVTTVKIFPSIGIARLGNSPSGFFVGPELPGDRTPPAGGYKDANCRIKRQAARFRLFGYDANGGLVGEITQADASIVWTVHLANTKAAARQFAGLDPKAPLRNSGPLPGVSPIADRSRLSIDPGPRSLSGANQSAVFDSGTFLGSPVPLGEIRTESDGRLIVLGGFGNSNSPFGVPLTTFANNDRWHDDVSDGPVTAQVTLNGTKSLVSAVPAWVICGPPDFAPPVDSVTTLWDVLFQVAVDKGWLHVPATPSLSNDVYPILRRSLAIEATYAMAAGKHDVLFGAAFPAGGAADRAKVVGRVNDPNNVNGIAGADMPMLFNDSNAAGEVVTRAQYEVLTKWRDGTFKGGLDGQPAAGRRCDHP